MSARRAAAAGATIAAAALAGCGGSGPGAATTTTPTAPDAATAVAAYVAAVNRGDTRAACASLGPSVQERVVESVGGPFALESAARRPGAPADPLGEGPARCAAALRAAMDRAGRAAFAFPEPATPTVVAGPEGADCVTSSSRAAGLPPATEGACFGIAGPGGPTRLFAFRGADGRWVLGLPGRD